jgi:hypothetical protein
VLQVTTWKHQPFSLTERSRTSIYRATFKPTIRARNCPTSCGRSVEWTWDIYFTSPFKLLHTLWTTVKDKSSTKAYSVFCWKQNWKSVKFDGFVWFYYGVVIIKVYSWSKLKKQPYISVIKRLLYQIKSYTRNITLDSDRIYRNPACGLIGLPASETGPARNVFPVEQWTILETV